MYVRGNRYKIRSTKAITLFFVLYYKNTGSTSTRMYFYFPYCHYGSSTRTWTSQNLKQRTANHVITVGGIDFVFLWNLSITRTKIIMKRFFQILIFEQKIFSKNTKRKKKFNLVTLKLNKRKKIFKKTLHNNLRYIFLHNRPKKVNR